MPRGLSLSGWPPRHTRVEIAYRHPGDLPRTLAPELRPAGPEHIRSSYKSSLAGYRPEASGCHGLEAHDPWGHEGNLQAALPGLLPP